MKQVIATVSQEGRFLVATTNEGVDVSNQIDRPLRRKAAETGKQLIKDMVTGTWSFAASNIDTKPAALLEIVAANSEHEVMKQFIHDSTAIKPDQLIITDLKWKYLVRSAMRGKNILMVGPAGTGKTMAAKYLSSALKRPEFYFNLGATQDPRATLIGNKYTSTRVLDKALYDRFITIEMDQLDTEMEFRLLKMKYAAVEDKLLQSVAEIADATRRETKASNPKLTTALSTRAAVEVASLLYDGFTLPEAAEVSIYPFFSEDGGVDSERTYVKQIVQKYCVNPETEGEELFGADDVAKEMPF